MRAQLSHPEPDIASAIRATGARVTPARVRVLAALGGAKGPLSHGEIEDLLRQQALPEMDRVTLYRVLEWLVESGLAHRATNARGIFCFTLARTSVEHERHMHFRCTECGKVVCLDEPPPPPPKLPAGFHLSSVALDIRGECPECTHALAPRTLREAR